MSFLGTIKSKEEAIDYMLKYPNIFSKYDCSELELMFKYGKKDFQKLLELSSNFNEYIKLFCLHIVDIQGGNYIIDLNKCPIPDENYNIKDLKKFTDYTIQNKELYFPYEQFKGLVAKLNNSNYDKLLELKSIFKNYESCYKSNEIRDALNKAIHETGKSFIKQNKLDNFQIISFIQEDAKTYNKDYEKNYEYSNLIGYINFDEVDNKFIKKFK